jgi:hypothetical protein
MEVIKYSDFENLSKKQIESRALEVAKTYIDSGEEDSMDMLLKIIKMKDFISVMETKLRADLEEDFESEYGKSYVKNGAAFTYTNGAKKLQYEEDLEYKELKEKLKQREGVLKAAAASKEMYFDSGGIEVPRVSATFNKSSIQIKY